MHCCVVWNSFVVVSYGNIMFGETRSVTNRTCRQKHQRSSRKPEKRQEILNVVLYIVVNSLVKLNIYAESQKVFFNNFFIAGREFF